MKLIERIKTCRKCDDTQCPHSSTANTRFRGHRRCLHGKTEMVKSPRKVKNVWKD